MDFTINITGLSTTGSFGGNSDVVTIVNYDLTASDAGYSASASHTVQLAPPFEGADFTSYSSLTEEQVKEWVNFNPTHLIHRGPLEESIYKQKQTLQGSLPWDN